RPGDLRRGRRGGPGAGVDGPGGGQRCPACRARAGVARVGCSPARESGESTVVTRFHFVKADPLTGRFDVGTFSHGNDATLSAGLLSASDRRRGAGRPRGWERTDNSWTSRRSALDAALTCRRLDVGAFADMEDSP